MMTSLLVAAVFVAQPAAFQFEGGSDYELCKRVSLAINQPVVILAQPDRKWLKFSFEYEDVKDFKRLLRSKLGLDSIQESTCGIASQFYAPEYVLFKNGYHRKEQPIHYPSITLKEGAISISTENGPASLGAFFSVPTKKKVTWHWFFNDMMLCGYVKNASEETFVKTVAEAIGAKVVESDTCYKLEVDPIKYRDRGVALMNALAMKRDALACDYLFTGACLKELSDKQIGEMLVSPETELEVAIYATSVLAAAQNRLQTRFPVKRDNIRRDQSMLLIWEQISPKIDWSKRPHAIIKAGSLYSLKYFGKPEDPCEWTF